DSLKRYVQGGGALLVGLGASSAQLPRVPVADDAIDTSRYAARDGNRFMTVSDLDTGHTVLKHAGRFEGVKFYQAIGVTPSNSQVLAKLSDGTPLLLERQIGEGHVLTFTSAFDNVANDFPLHNSWVPFVQDAAYYLAGGGADQQPNLSVDTYVELRTG